LFQEEEVDVGLAFFGSQNIVGPITFAAVFLPTSKHKETLLRYDLYFSKAFHGSKESLADIERYNRL
jgi:hypothetical protein